MPSSWIAGSYDSFIPRFLRNLHTVLPGGCVNLHFHQQHKGVPFSLFLTHLRPEKQKLFSQTHKFISNINLYIESEEICSFIQNIDPSTYLYFLIPKCVLDSTQSIGDTVQASSLYPSSQGVSSKPGFDWRWLGIICFGLYSSQPVNQTFQETTRLSSYCGGNSTLRAYEVKAKRKVGLW